METVILIGLPASGKTSFYKARLSETHVHVSKDGFPNARNKQGRQDRLIDEALANGQCVAVDNMNVSRTERAAIIRHAKAAKSTVRGYYFSSKVEDSLARNQKRTGRAKVPDVAILAAAKRFERPAMDEGFDRLFYVRMNEDGSFRIEPWIEEPAAHIDCTTCGARHHPLDDETCQNVHDGKEIGEAERRLFGS